MSAEQRKAVAERMKRYWAGRRSAAASPKTGAPVAGSDGAAAPRRKSKTGRAKSAGGRRKMSAAARKRISDAQKARWAKQKNAAA